jgi:hypothetical protein
MATKFKIWIEIERIDNVGTDNETFINEDCPIGIAYRDNIIDAVALQEEINQKFGEIM